MIHSYKKFRAIPAVLLITGSLLQGCTKDTTPDPGPGPGTSGVWGKTIPIPDVSAGDAALDLKTSNEGIYFHVMDGSSDKDWIYRLQNGDASPDWTIHEQPNLYHEWEPSSENTEVPNQFSIFFKTSSKNGFVNINSSLPALMEENNPSGHGEMLVDNSPQAYKWTFAGSTVKVQQNNSSGQWDPICTLPNSGGINFAEADPTDAVVWAVAGKVLYRITVNGGITSFDVSSYDNPDILIESIAKIRFSQDVLDKDVYFRCEDKVFKITDGTTMSLFYTIDYGANFFGGDFAVDNSYMYATDGTKKDLSLLTETNIIPPQPNTTDQQVLLDFITRRSAFNVGPIEVSRDPLDKYIYVINNTNIVKIPKSL